MPAEGNKRAKRSYSWLELYEAKSSDQPIRTTSERPRGRPPRVLAAKKRAVYLTSGEEEAITRWQAIFSELFGRKVALGETTGILARICADRFDLLSELFSDAAKPASMPELIDLLVGAESARKRARSRERES